MKTLKKLFAALLALTLAAALTACGAPADTSALWDNAAYREDTELGDGGKTAHVEVCAGDKTVTFTLHTDKKTVGDALLEQGLIAGDDAGFFSTLNGMTADYSADKAYWAFYIDGEFASVGADQAEIDGASVYRFVYTK